MSRWHKPSCDLPDVIVEDSTKYPKCQACDSVFGTLQLEQLISQQDTSTGNPWSPPPDKRIGEWNLSWPPSVRYTGCQQSQLDVQTKTSVAEVDQFGVYERPLEPGEIRLMSIAAAEINDYPFHASLEIWDHDYCVEYETVSYTWGGEDGDSRRHSPIYIGPYWDVMLQTRNCLSMLLHVRPKRGTRTMWVDAICINQNHVMERQRQVAKMDEIYQRCLRVVVFLGDEVVKESSRLYRPRQPLQAVERDLIERKYFGRVWIIQELILSPALIFPIGEVDYLAQSLTPSRLKGGHTTAPWLSNMGHGRHFLKLKITEALRQTWNSVATDRRDKIFGLLGLVDNKFTGEGPHNGLVPEYSISFIEAFVGVCGYTLATLSDPIILMNCWKYRPREDLVPSWVPDWQSSSIWDPEPPLLQKLWNLKWNHINKRTFYMICVRAVDKFQNQPDSQPQWTTLPPVRRQIPAAVPWNQTISITAANGALSIRLTHLMNLSGLQIIPLAEFSAPGLTAFQFEGETSSLNFCTAEIPIDQIIKSQPDDIFMMDTGSEEDLLLFFMKKTDSENSYRIIACCRCYLLYLQAEEHTSGPSEYFNHHKERLGRLWNNEEMIHKNPERNCDGFLGLYSIAEIKSWWRSGLRDINLDQEFLWSDGPREARLFPSPSSGKITERDFLSLVWSLLDEQEEAKSGYGAGWENSIFEKHCLALLQLRLEEFQPRLKEGMLILQYTNIQLKQQQKEWQRQFKYIHEYHKNTGLAHLSSPCMISDTWEVKYTADSQWCSPLGLADPGPDDVTYNFMTSDLVYMRADPKVFWRCVSVRACYLFDGLKCLREFTGVEESEIEMALSEMKPEYETTYAMFWPKRAKQELGLDYLPQTVTIV